MPRLDTHLLSASAAAHGAEPDSAEQHWKPHLSRLGAVFVSGEQARAAAQRLCRETGISAGRVRVFEPNDPGIGRKLRRSLRADVILPLYLRFAIGAAGVLLGVMLALAFASAGSAQYGWVTVLVCALFGLAAGRLFGDLVASGPDQGAVIAWIKGAAKGGRWFVLVHIRDLDEQRRVKLSLLGMSQRVSGFL